MNMTKLEKARENYIQAGIEQDQALYKYYQDFFTWNQYWDDLEQVGNENAYNQARDKYNQAVNKCNQALDNYNQAGDKLLELEITNLLATKISISAWTII